MDENMIFQKYLYESIAKYKDNVALKFMETKLTYREVHTKSDYILRQLEKNNIKKSAQVILMLESKVDLILSIIACLKGGYVFVPFDTSYPDKKLIDMYNTIDSHIIITDHINRERINMFSMDHKQDDNRILIEESLLWKDSITESFYIEERYLPDDPTYIYFTSGSTGKPKAIVGRNKGLLHYILWEIETFDVDETSIISLLSTPCHDPMLRDVFTAFLAGGQTCIPENKEVILDMLKLSSWIDEEHISIMHITPSIFFELNEIDLKNYSFTHLQYIFMSGERINSRSLKNWFEVFGDRIGCINLYGATETTMTKTFYRIKPEDAQKSNIPIGKPMQGAKIIILDEKMNICPKGVIGEMYIRTPYDSLGYYHEESNQHSFIKNPFGYSDKDLLYKTGDLGKMLSDGNLEFHGRKDRQVKIRGIRVELGEIECNMVNYGGIIESAVVQKKIGNNEVMVAYYTSDQEIQENELKDYLSRCMNDNIIPVYYNRLDHLPRLKNGKVDYRSLKNRKQITHSPLKKPKNKTEEALAEIWKEILELDEVGVDQNFLQIGGHSLKIMTMITRINRRFDIEISLSEIFNDATIEHLARIIDSKIKVEEPEIIVSVEKQPYYVVSNAQRRMYALWEKDKKGISYNMPAAYWITGDIDRDKFEKAFQVIISRHEILRTKFAMKQGQLVQIVEDLMDFHIDYVELEKEQLDDFISNFIKPFDLTSMPLIRATIAKVNKKYVFLVDMHHIVGDALSMEIIIEELISHYSGENLSHVKLQYRDYCVWLDKFMKEKQYKKQEEYWLKLYSKRPSSLNLHTDFNKKRLNSYEGKTIRVDLDDNLYNKIHQCASDLVVTPNIVFLSTFILLLYRYSHQNDIVVGSIVAGRTNREVEDIIGPFINTLAIKYKVSEGNSFQDFVSEVKKVFVQAYENQDYPFDQLVEQLNISGGDGHNPLFDMVFDYQVEDKHNIDIQNLDIEPMVIETDVAKFHLCLHVTEMNNSFSIGLEYRTGLFSEDTIKRMIRHYLQMISQAIDHTEAKIEKINILTLEEKKQIENYSGDPLISKTYDTIDGMFEKQVELYNDHTAIEYHDRTNRKVKITYQELNEKANQLAYHLDRKGIQHGDIIGILMEDIHSAIISMLGILKAGATYVPIGTGYYTDNFIANIVNESGMKACMVDEHIVRDKKDLINQIKVIQEQLEVIDYSDVEDSLQVLPRTNLFKKHSEESIAYVIYTSGTTGVPKGVQIRHKGLVNIADVVKPVMEIHEESRVLQFSSLSFDMSVWEIYTTLLNASTLCIFSKANKMNNQLDQFLRKEEITIATLTPSVLKILSPDGLSLKTVVSAGESCTVDIIKKWNSGRKLINAYGPTETTICATLHVVEDENPNNIGKPIENSNCYILDLHGNKCPIGVIGELYVGGIGVSAGYINNQEITKEKFIEIPWIDGQVIYKTGDLGRWKPNGDIEIYGRVDEQVKIRGFRLELGHIESIIDRFTGIKSNAVVKYETDELYCFYIADDQLEANQIKRYLNEELPNYMIPNYFIQLDNMPLTSGGKVDKKSLYELCDLNNDEAIEHIIQPRSPKEETLLDIWKNVLRKKNITIEDNFYEIGGHSLNAIQIVSKAKESGIQLKVEELFVYNSIKELSDNGIL